MVSLTHSVWLLTNFLFLILRIDGPTTNDFPMAFDELPSYTGQLNFTNTLQFHQEGGHLQGIQKYRNDRLFLSGSSDSKAYLVEVALDGAHQTIGVYELMSAPFRHAGGFQVFDQYLAIGVEDNIKRTVSKVMIYDLEQDEHSRTKPIYTLRREGDYERVTAGAVGMAAYKEFMVLAVANWDSRNIDIYACPLEAFHLKTGSFELISSISAASLNKENWSDSRWLSYQNINLFADRKEDLFLVGFAKDREDRQVADLFELSLDLSGNKSAGLRKINSRVFQTTDGVDFKAGAGMSVDKSGKLSLVACPYQIQDTTVINQFQ